MFQWGNEIIHEFESNENHSPLPRYSKRKRTESEAEKPNVSNDRKKKPRTNSILIQF